MQNINIKINGGTAIPDSEKSEKCVIILNEDNNFIKFWMSCDV